MDWDADTNVPMSVSDWYTHLFPPGPWAFPVFHALAKGQVPTPISHFYTLEMSRIILDSLQCA